MEEKEILRIIAGLQKKHGVSFCVSLKYVTDSGKIRKRFGNFQELTEEGELILFNEEKKSKGHYFIERIKHIEKMVNP